MKPKMLLIPALLLLLTLSACNKTPQDKLEKRSNQITRYLTHKLDLTEDQQVVVKAQVLLVGNQMIDLKDIHDSLMNELATQFEGETIDVAADAAKLKEQLGTPMNSALTTALTEFHTTLTPEQRKIVADYIREKVSKE